MPHVAHILLAHARPAPVQVPPGLHGWLTPPHAMHRPAPAPPQISPPPQVRLGQHVCELPPQGTQLLVPLQIRPLAVQVAPAQHGSLAPPQVPQLPLVHGQPIVGQVPPEAVQKPPTQQPLPLQVSSGQQACVAPPHGTHSPTPPPLQTSTASQARPAQHAWPGPPHA